MSRLPPPLDDVPAETPVLIAGPTGSGKSALALAFAEERGGVVINADALQVYSGWRILTARPPPADTERAPHRLYGHVPRHESYSAGHWLRELAPLLGGARRPIIVGGTGLYFSALTQGLAEIPPTPGPVRATADALSLEELCTGIDRETLAQIDRANRARVQRAWEVQTSTGRSLAAWQRDTPPPLMELSQAACVLIDAPKDALTPRLERRFDAMLAEGALEEVRANLADFDPQRPGDKAIGASELAAHLRGETSLDAARDAAVIATRRYAKRQRTWFRARMSNWARIPMSA